MHNQECRIRSKIKDINGNKPLFYPYNIQVGKCRKVVMISVISMQNYVLLMLLKT